MNIGKHWVLHSFFFAAYTVLALYAHNIEEVAFREILPVLSLVVGMAVMLFTMVLMIVREPRRSGIIATAILIIILFYGTAFDILDDVLGGRLSHKFFFPTVCVLLGGSSYFLLRSESRVRNANSVLNLMTVVLMSVPLLSIMKYTLFSDQSERAIDALAYGPTEDIVVEASETRKKPHIFFLIFDRYPANSTLREQFDFDNQDFLQFLDRKGFFIASRSSANYLKTAHSLASTFHMDYINFLSEEVGMGSDDWKPVYSMLKDNRVLRNLRRLGYRYVHMGSWWEPTRVHERADENYNVDAVSEVVRVYLLGTVLPFVSNNVLPRINSAWSLSAILQSDRRKEQCTRVPYKFAKLNEIVEREEPTFVFAHMLIPHDPYVFDADGRCITREEAKRRSLRENFIGQLEYVNKELHDLVERLQEKNNKAIIILQADEGPFPKRYVDIGESFDWRKASRSELEMKYRVLNAIYLPDMNYENLYSSISPVNTFRLVFSMYFGAELPLLSDRHYAFVSEHRLYDFFEITDDIR